MNLWIDDLRSAPEGEWVIARTSVDAIRTLAAARTAGVSFELVNFDHDLGGEDDTRRVLTWMIEHEYWPRAIRVHSMNPVGRKWLIGTARRYAPATTLVG